MIINDDCMSCGACYDMCPTEAIQVKRDSAGYGKYTIDQSKCIDCWLCLRCDCPGDALKK